MNYPKNLDVASKYNYKFWKDQPMTKFKEIISKEDQIVNVESDKISKEADVLPQGFVWSNIDFNSREQTNKLSEFLSKYYMVDQNEYFSGVYTAEFIEWIYKDKDSVAVTVNTEKNNSIVGVIIGRVIKLRLNKNILDTVETNFLCIHPKLRNKRLVPQLIKELKRQFNLKGYFHGTFVDTEYIYTPFATVKRFNRAINPKQLVETKYIRLEDKVNIKDVKKTLKLPEKPSKNFVKMEEHHIDQAFDVFNNYIGKYSCHIILNKKEFNDLFINNKFVTAYVKEDNDGNVLDFISYYFTHSNVLKYNEKFKVIRKANLFYYTCTNETEYRMIKDILVVARDNCMDVFNASEIMENQYVLKELGFEENSANLHYYMYNWRTKSLKVNQLCYINF